MTPRCPNQHTHCPATCAGPDRCEYLATEARTDLRWRRLERILERLGVAPAKVTHTLKTWPKPFSAVWGGTKTFEVRWDDRGYEVGHRLLLREFIPGDDGYYTGREILADVPYLLRGPNFGVPDGMVVMSLSVRSRTGWDGRPSSSPAPGRGK